MITAGIYPPTPLQNIEALCEALLSGFRKLWDTERIRRHGEKYTWGQVADQLISVYEEVLAGQTESRAAYARLREQA